MKSLSHEIAYVLSLNVIRRDSNDITLKQIPLLQLTKLLLTFWQIQTFVRSVNYKFQIMKISIRQSAIVTSKLLSIGFNSVRYGLGGQYV